VDAEDNQKQHSFLQSLRGQSKCTGDSTEETLHGHSPTNYAAEHFSRAKGVVLIRGVDREQHRQFTARPLWGFIKKTQPSFIVLLLRLRLFVLGVFPAVLLLLFDDSVDLLLVQLLNQSRDLCAAQMQ